MDGIQIIKNKNFIIYVFLSLGDDSSNFYFCFLIVTRAPTLCWGFFAVFSCIGL